MELRHHRHGLPQRERPVNFEAASPEPDAKVKRIAEVSKYLEQWHEPLESDLVDEILDEE